MEVSFDDGMNTRLRNKDPIAHPALLLAYGSEQKLLSFSEPQFLIYNPETIKLDI